jgi:hypothetical protein
MTTPCHCGARDCSSCGIGPNPYALEEEEEERERERLHSDLADAVKHIGEELGALRRYNYGFAADAIEKILSTIKREEGLTKERPPKP